MFEYTSVLMLFMGASKVGALQCCVLIQATIPITMLFSACSTTYRPYKIHAWSAFTIFIGIILNFLAFVVDKSRVYNIYIYIYKQYIYIGRFRCIRGHLYDHSSPFGWNRYFNEGAFNTKSAYKHNSFYIQIMGCTINYSYNCSPFHHFHSRRQLFKIYI